MPRSLPIPTDDGWETITYDGDDTEAAFTCQALRFTHHDALEVAAWDHERKQLLEQGQHTPLDLAQLAFENEVRAVARRCRNGDGEMWTEALVRELAGRSWAAYEWLVRWLYRPILEPQADSEEGPTVGESSPGLWMAARVPCSSRPVTAANVCSGSMDPTEAS